MTSIKLLRSSGPPLGDIEPLCCLRREHHWRKYNTKIVLSFQRRPFWYELQVQEDHLILIKVIWMLQFLMACVNQLGNWLVYGLYHSMTFHGCMFWMKTKKNQRLFQLAHHHLALQTTPACSIHGLLLTNELYGTIIDDGLLKFFMFSIIKFKFFWSLCTIVPTCPRKNI